MGWLLIVTFLAADPGISWKVTATLTSEAACEKARETMHDRLAKRFSRIETQCKPEAAA